MEAIELEDLSKKPLRETENETGLNMENVAREETIDDQKMKEIKKTLRKSRGTFVCLVLYAIVLFFGVYYLKHHLIPRPYYQITVASLVTIIAMSSDNLLIPSLAMTLIGGFLGLYIEVLYLFIIVWKLGKLGLYIFDKLGLKMED